MCMIVKYFFFKKSNKYYFCIFAMINVVFLYSYFQIQFNCENLITQVEGGLLRRRRPEELDEGCRGGGGLLRRRRSAEEVVVHSGWLGGLWRRKRLVEDYETWGGEKGLHRRRGPAEEEEARRRRGGLASMMCNCICTSCAFIPFSFMGPSCFSNWAFPSEHVYATL